MKPQEKAAISKFIRNAYEEHKNKAGEFSNYTAYESGFNDGVDLAVTILKLMDTRRQEGSESE